MVFGFLELALCFRCVLIRNEEFSNGRFQVIVRALNGVS